MTIQLIIFDCDGVLVDSEGIANRVFHELLVEAGIAISSTDSFATFTGLSTRSCIDFVEKQFSKSLSNEFANQYEEKVMDAFKIGLKPIEGIRETLVNILQPVCVASGSSHERIRLCLGLTGLLPKFDNNIFSASDVTQGKPAPDLFLYAAEEMGYRPEHCAVIEDSVPGVQAGVAAGMTVFAYTGSHKAELLASAGAHFVFDDMHSLSKLLNVYSNSRHIEIV